MKYAGIRATIQSKLDSLRRRTSKVDGDLLREAAPLDRDSEERALELENEEVLEGLSAEGRDQIAKLEDALARIEAGTYGSCDTCGGKIPVARLQALPWATACLACASNRERARAR